MAALTILDARRAAPGRGLARGAVAAATVALLTTVAAGAADGGHESARHLRASTWVLGTCAGGVRIALVDTDTGRVQPVDVGGVQGVEAWTTIARDRDDDWLFALDRREDGRALVKVPLPAGGTARVMRRYPSEGEGALEAWLRTGPGHTLLLAARREGRWVVDVMNPDTGAVERQVGPLPRRPRDVTLLDSGRWLILDDAALWTWPDEQVLLVSAAGAPARWSEPPPMLRDPWPEHLVVLPDGSLILGSSEALTLVDGELEQHIAGVGRGWRFPAEAGKAREAAVQGLGRPELVDDRGHRVFVWDRGSQRVLRLDAPAPPPEGNYAWNLTTVWSRPPGDPGPAVADQAWLRQAFEGAASGWMLEQRPWLDRLDELAALDLDDGWLAATLEETDVEAMGVRILARNLLDRRGAALDAGPPPGPGTVGEILAAWRSDDWLDWAETPLARFLVDHRQELYVLASHREEAVARLLEQDSPRATMALATLDAEEAAPRFRELVMDSTGRAGADGCVFARSTIGARAWEQLEQAPLGDLLRLSARERAAIRRARAAGADGADERCGDAAFARHLRALLEDAP